jgi:hypothetical protein
MPTPRTVAQIKANLLRPALTSHFEVQITKPEGLTVDYLSNNGIPNLNQEKLQLLCSETVLPGSSLATHEINNDFTGVTERHAYRRLYDDRIDLSFYVDAENYLPIRFFETWIKYAVNENTGDSTDGKLLGSKNPAYFYRVNYPNLYIAPEGLTITKFERDYKSKPLTYKFVNVFPIAVTSIPVSYDASSLLKCTVSLTYIRYYIDPTSDKQPNSSNFTTQNFNYFNLTPQQLADLNKQTFTPNINLTSLGNFTSTGGIPFNTSAATGNAIDVNTLYSGNFSLNVK